jgi:hypothetical protein
METLRVHASTLVLNAASCLKGERSRGVLYPHRRYYSLVPLLFASVRGSVLGCKRMETREVDGDVREQGQRRVG